MVTVILSSSDYFSPYLAVCVYSIAHSCSDAHLYEIIIAERDISQENKKKLISIVAKYKNISIHFLNVSDKVENIRFFLNNERLSQETYYGILMPYLLPEIKKAIIMDCDMVVKKDLAELYETPLEGYIAGGVNDSVLKGWLCDPQKDMYSYYTKELHIKNPFLCINGGLLLLDFEKYRNEIPLNRILYCINNLNLRVVDQDLCNILLENKCKLLDSRWNHMVYLEGYVSDAISHAPIDEQTVYFNAKENPFIIHYASDKKPWFCPEIEFSADFWEIAHRTPFYEQILSQMIDKKIDSLVLKLQTNRSFARKVLDFFLPKNSKRRKIVKQFFPKESFHYRLIYNAYHVFCKKQKTGIYI